LTLMRNWLFTNIVSIRGGP